MLEMRCPACLENKIEEEENDLYLCKLCNTKITGEQISKAQILSMIIESQECPNADV